MEKITLDMFTKDSVSVKRQEYIVQDNVEYATNNNIRKSYSNSTSSRQELEEEVPDPYKNIILMMWGDEPTVGDVTQ